MVPAASLPEKIDFSHFFESLSHTMHTQHTSTSSFKYVLYISENIVHTTRLTLKSCVEYSCVVP